MSPIFKAFQENRQLIKCIIAKYRPNPDDVEELAQETFLRGFATELDTKINEPEHFLKRVARNLAIKAAQKKTNSAGISVEEIGGEAVLKDDAYISSEDALDSRQKLFILSEALGSLDSNLREALIMRRVEGLKYKQIATRLNVSVSTVEKRVANAALGLIVYLRKQGYDPGEFSLELSKAKHPKPSSKNSLK